MNKQDMEPVLEEGYTYPDLKVLVRHCLEKRVSVLVRGHPGIGKSSMAKELAAEMNLPLELICIGHRDPAEICGVYFPNKETGNLDLFSPGWVKRAHEKPMFICLDEVNIGVTKLHQSVCYQILHERRVGDIIFHKDTVILALGNLEEDGPIVTPLSSGFTGRCANFILRVSADAWVNHAIDKGLSADITAYIAFGKEPVLYKNTGEAANPSPRSWEGACLLDGEDTSGKDIKRKRLVGSRVGQAATAAFFTFLTVYRHVDIDGILKRGVIPDFSGAHGSEPSFMYAVTFAVASTLKERGLKREEHQNFATFLTAQGYGDEFKVLLIKSLADTPVIEIIKTDKIFRGTVERLSDLVLPRRKK